MIAKFFKAIAGLLIMPFKVRLFHPHSIFKDKRIAIVGPASSAFKKENGAFIDSFDVVIRINKAPYSLNEVNSKFIGTRTDILFHSFYENDETGGGPLDFDLYQEKEIGYVVNPRNNYMGWRMTFNFYKKYRKPLTTYVLPAKVYGQMIKPFGHLRPTVGYAALFSALNTSFKELFITGFTFFKTPYASGYRDQLLNVEINKQHIKSQGIHDPDLEFSLFCELMKETRAGTVNFDEELSRIMAAHQV